MIPLAKEDFRTYLIAASFTAVKFAQLFVKDKLPFEFSYQLLINDGTPPRYENLLSENEVVDILHRSFWQCNTSEIYQRWYDYWTTQSVRSAMFISKLTLEYLESLLPITMGFLHHGILHNYIECDVFMEFAIREARDNPEMESTYLDLFVSDEPSEQRAIILKMCDANSKTTDIADAWLFVLECSIRDFSQSATEMLDKIEDLYESMDYPTELSPFVRYMPCSDLVSVDVNMNEEQMIIRFKQFLAKKQNRINHV